MVTQKFPAGLPIRPYPKNNPDTVFFCTFRADAMTEFGFGVVADIDFHLITIPLVVSDFLAGGADR